MEKKAGKALKSFVCCMFIVMLGGVGANVYAQDGCPDGSGNCNISGEYQINGKRALKMSESNGKLRDIFIGENAGAMNPDFNGRAMGNVLIGRDTGTKLIDGGVNTFVGDKAGEYIIHSVHNTFIGAQANGLACSENVPCDSNPLPQYNTAVGTMAGLMNYGDYNNFFGTEAGKFITTGQHNILIGVNAGAAYGGGGPTNLTTGDGNIHIGGYTEAANGDISYSLAIGLGAKAEDDNQIVFGSDFYYKESYWGSGVTSATPQNFSFNATGGSGENVAGADLIIAGGKSTGSAVGGSIKLQTAPSGTSGSNQNSLQDRLVIDSDGNVTIGDGSTPVSPWLSFDASLDDCDMGYNSGSDWLYMNCAIWPEAVYLRGNQVWLDAPAYGTLRAKANQQLNLQSPIIYLTGTDTFGTPNDSNVKVGIGTATPQSTLAVSGLPNTPPDSSGASYIVCIDPSGNLWVDDDGVNDCQ